MNFQVISYERAAHFRTFFTLLCSVTLTGMANLFSASQQSFFRPKVIKDKAARKTGASLQN